MFEERLPRPKLTVPESGPEFEFESDRESGSGLMLVPGLLWARGARRLVA